MILRMAFCRFEQHKYTLLSIEKHGLKDQNIQGGMEIN